MRRSRAQDDGTIRMTQKPIADYALLSDCHAAALVARDGSVDWLCCPRFDSPSLFGHLLDEDAGRWCIRAVDATETTRAYVRDTLVLETTYTTATGTVVLLDALAVGRNERGHELGADTPSAMLRILDMVEGDVEIEMEFAPRPEYGLVKPLLRVVDAGLAHRGWFRPTRVVVADPAHRRRRDCDRALPDAAWGATGVRAPAPDERTTAAAVLGPGRDRESGRRYRRGLAHVVGAAPGVRGAVARPRAPQRPGPLRAHVLPDGRDVRRADDVVARDPRR